MTRPSAVAFAVLAALPACSKPDATKEAVSTSPRIVLGQGSPAAPPVDTAADEAGPASPIGSSRAPLEFDGAPLVVTVTETVEASVAPTVDPDQATIQAARVAASACFVGVQGGPDVRSAVLDVNVVPSGQVSRTSVRADTTARDLIDCLTRVGDGLHFSSKDSQSEGIRSFSINVTVARTH